MNAFIARKCFRRTSRSPWAWSRSGPWSPLLGPRSPAAWSSLWSINTAVMHHTSCRPRKCASREQIRSIISSDSYDCNLRPRWKVIDTTTYKHEEVDFAVNTNTRYACICVRPIPISYCWENRSQHWKHYYQFSLDADVDILITEGNAS